MNEPITLADIIMADLMYTIGCFVALGALLILIGIASKYEEWKESKPDWKNDWE